MYFEIRFDMWIHIHTYVHVHVHIDVDVDVCVCVCACVWVCVYVMSCISHFMWGLQSYTYFDTRRYTYGSFFESETFSAQKSPRAIATHHTILSKRTTFHQFSMMGLSPAQICFPQTCIPNLRTTWWLNACWDHWYETKTTSLFWKTGHKSHYFLMKWLEKHPQDHSRWMTSHPQTIFLHNRIGPRGVSCFMCSCLEVHLHRASHQQAWLSLQECFGELGFPSRRSLLPWVLEP